MNKALIYLTCSMYILSFEKIPEKTQMFYTKATIQI